MQTTFGELTPPLGTHRLKVVELLGTLVNARYVSVYATLLDTDVLSTLLVRFFLLVYNNFINFIKNRIYFFNMNGIISYIPLLVEFLLLSLNQMILKQL